MRRRALTIGMAAIVVFAGCADDASDDDTTSITNTPAVVSQPASTEMTPTSETAATTEPVASTAGATAPTSSPTLPAVFEFADAVDADGWRVVNDTVMGGVSTGELAWVDGELVFTGELSLENNGGFASIRSPELDPRVAVDWSARDGILVRADGDGRTWTVEVRTGDDDGGWIQSFDTQPEAATEVLLRWSAFEPVTRFLDPREADAPLDPSSVRTIAFYLVDGVEGPFRLGVRSIG
jgi:hypothetical protein